MAFRGRSSQEEEKSRKSRSPPAITRHFSALISLAWTLLNSEKITKYEIASLLEDALVEPQDLKDQAVAEQLTRRFLAWNLKNVEDPEENLMEKLQQMIQESDKAIVEAAEASNQSEEETSEDEGMSDGVD